MKIAIINGYPRAARDEFDRFEIPQGDELFDRILRELLPDGRWDVFHPADGDPALRLDEYDGYIWTGSNGTIYGDAPENKRQVEIMRAMFELDRPIWGSCWGLQVAALAGGGDVRAGRAGREWLAAREVVLNERGRGHAMFREKPECFDSLVMHLDEVTRLPEGAELLASNAHSEVQAFELRRGESTFWGTQYHPEFDFVTMARLLKSRAGALISEGHLTDESLKDVVENLNRVAENLKDEPDVVPEDLIDNVELAVLGDELELTWTVFNKSLKLLELSNWVEDQFLPSLKRRGRL